MDSDIIETKRRFLIAKLIEGMKIGIDVLYHQEASPDIINMVNDYKRNYLKENQSIKDSLDINNIYPPLTELEKKEILTAIMGKSIALCLQNYDNKYGKSRMTEDK
jgi:hypothetical protein